MLRWVDGWGLPPVQISWYKYFDTNILIQEWVDGMGATTGSDILIQIFRFKYLDTNILIQISWYKYLDSNILIQIFWFKYLDPGMGGWLGSTSSGPIWFPHHVISRLIRESRLYSIYSILYINILFPLYIEYIVYIISMQSIQFFYLCKFIQVCWASSKVRFGLTSGVWWFDWSAKICCGNDNPMDINAMFCNVMDSNVTACIVMIIKWIIMLCNVM